MPLGDHHPVHALLADGFVINFDRDRRWPGILAAFEGFASMFDAHTGDGVLVRAFAQAHRRRFDLDQFFTFERFQNLVSYPGKGQGNFFGNLKAGKKALEIEDFQGQVLQPKRR